MTLISQAIKRPVMSTADARTVSVVAGFIIDPTDRRILAVRLAKTPGTADTLHWDDITAFGPDAVTVPAETAITPARGRAAELTGRDAELLGKRLLTDTGVELGKVEDVDFDPANGSINYLIGAHDRHAGTRLLGCGSYAVIIRAV